MMKHSKHSALKRVASYQGALFTLLYFSAIFHIHPIQASCLPVIQVAHIESDCREKKQETNLPTVETPCGELQSLTYQDSYYELTFQTESGFSGYFAISRWEKKSGDGGVDVTGAPNSVLVEGAGIAQVTVAPKSTLLLRIAVPAKGFAAFDWKNVGGSNLLFQCQTNETAHSIARPGFYRSPLLHAGDQLSLYFQNNDDTAQQIQLSKFRFMSNYSTIIERTWLAEDTQGNRSAALQFIALRQPAITQVVFPDHVDDTNPRWTNTLTPSALGYPVFDEDGDLFTTHDQYAIAENNCSLHLSWQDEMTPTVLLRHWKVQDTINGNTVQHTQRIHLRYASDSINAPNLEAATPENLEHNPTFSRSQDEKKKQHAAATNLRRNL